MPTRQRSSPPATQAQLDGAAISESRPLRLQHKVVVTASLLLQSLSVTEVIREVGGSGALGPG